MNLLDFKLGDDLQIVKQYAENKQKYSNRMININKYVNEIESIVTNAEKYHHNYMSGYKLIIFNNSKIEITETKLFNQLYSVREIQIGFLTAYFGVNEEGGYVLVNALMYKPKFVEKSIREKFYITETIIKDTEY